jgi:hypothetical protein
LILQLNPGVSPTQLKNNLISVAGSSIYETGLDNDWSDRRSLYGGEPKVLYNRFNQDISTFVSGEFVKFANIGA